MIEDRIGRNAMDLWPRGTPDLGMNDAELEALVFHRRRFGLYLSSSIYGLGDALRAWVGWPKFIPITVTMDHGVQFHDELLGWELTAHSRTHFTWSSWRANRKGKAWKRVMRIPHPYVSLRRVMSIEPRSDRFGTLLFSSHLLPGHRFPRVNYAHAIDAVVERVSVARPRAICLAAHDIRAGVHLELRSLGIPIVTVGSERSPAFPFRFYDLVGRFENAISADIGSQVFLTEEFGVPHFLGPSSRRTPDSLRLQVPPAARKRELLQSKVWRRKISNDTQRTREKLVEDALGVSLYKPSTVKLAREELLRGIPGALNRATVLTGSKFLELVSQSKP